MPVEDARSLCEPLVEVGLHCSKVNKVPPELMNLNRGKGTEHLGNRTAGIVRPADATQVGSIWTKASALSESGVDGLGNVADRRVLPDEWQQHAEKHDCRFHLPSDVSNGLPLSREAFTVPGASPPSMLTGLLRRNTRSSLPHRD